MKFDWKWNKLKIGKSRFEEKWEHHMVSMFMEAKHVTELWRPLIDILES